jgi:hypothetical protein
VPTQATFMVVQPEMPAGDEETEPFAVVGVKVIVWVFMVQIAYKVISAVNR